MMRLLVGLWLSFLPFGALAQDAPAVLASILDTHVIPGFSELQDDTADLAAIAQQDCTPGSPGLHAAYHEAFDSWIAVSHLRFGPAATDDRFFALAFWPDSRGATPKTLAQLITDQDPIIETAEGFAQVSVAARGFYALEFLLFDDATRARADNPYGCALIQRVTADIHRTSAAMLADWIDSEVPAMKAGGPGRYESVNAALLVFYASLTEGLEFTADLRLGRPMGTFDRPRPRRAEARRSARSLRNVQLSIQALGQLASMLGAISGADQSAIDAAFAAAQARGQELDDPIFAGVSQPQGRFAVEILQQRIKDASAVSQAELAPALGATRTFNSLDGD